MGFAGETCLLKRIGGVVKVLAMGNGIEGITEDLEVINHRSAASLFPRVDLLDLI